MWVYVLEMNEQALAEVMAQLEKKVGKERLSVIRRSAAKQKVPVITLLSRAVVGYADGLLDAEKNYISK